MNRLGTAAIALLAVILITDCAFAQRNATTYQSLLARTRQANAYVEVNAFPINGNTDSMHVVTHFRIEHDFLTFTRSSAADRPDTEFASDATIFVDFYKSGSAITQRAERTDAMMSVPVGTRRSVTPSSSGSSIAPIKSDVWRGITYADNYAQTISNRLYLHGSTTATLPIGEYDLIVSIREENQTRTRPVSRMRVRVQDVNNTESRVPMIMLTSSDANPNSIKLLGFGNQVPYGSDFDVLIPIPQDANPETFTLHVKGLQFNRRDTSVTNNLALIEIENEMLVTGNLTSSEDPASFDLVLTPGTRKWIRIPVEGSRFPNTPMRLELVADGKTAPHSMRMVQSKWVDIPTSLLNISVAIDMMENVLDKDEFRRVRRLNASEKEAYFKEYWAPKDPTPGTEYNELMVEYYRRVDITFERFSSATTPGFETDQGKTYILMGEPDRITRRFPPDAAALEIWEYGDRQIVFQATSGFGDFQIVRTNN
jgi:GWxTD domain-containing protein